MLLLTLITGCGGSTVPPQNPAPAIAPVVDDYSTLAVVPVRVTYVLQSLRPSLDSLFPMRDSLNAARCSAVAGLVCHQYVYQRDSLQLRSEGSRLLLNTRLAYRAQLGTVGVRRLASCGYAPESMRRASLSMGTTLYWRKDWRIGASNSTLSASLIDACRVTVLGVDATNTLRDLLNRQLAAFSADADTVIPRVADLKPLADSLWRSFTEPSALDSTNTLWLTLEPEAVRVTPFAGNGSSFTTSMVLYARPKVTAGEKPKVQLRPLPSLTLGDAPPAFVVPVTIELPFVELERRARIALAEETAASSVKVDSIALRGFRDSVRVDLTVSGSLRGRLSLVSRVRWDAATRELLLEDLDWSLESRGALSRVKASLGAPLISRAIRRATNNGRIPLGAQLDSVRVELMRKLNGPVAPGVVMGSSVRDVVIHDVTASATAFVVRARLTGQAGVWFQ